MIDEKLRIKLITALMQNKKNILEVQNVISSVVGSEGTRWNLLQAEFSLIEAIHQTRLIGKESEEKKEVNRIESESSEK